MCGTAATSHLWSVALIDMMRSISRSFNLTISIPLMLLQMVVYKMRILVYNYVSEIIISYSINLI